MHCFSSRVTSWLTRTLRVGGFVLRRHIGASVIRPSRLGWPTQQQRRTREAVAVVWPQPIPRDRHRKIEGKFSNIVGGVTSPILANIYLHELDEFMAEMRAGFDRGLKRRATRPYAPLPRRIHKLRREIDALRAAGAGEALIRPLRDEIRERQRERRSVPAVDPMDPGFCRLRYCRYADDCAPRRREEGVM